MTRNLSCGSERRSVHGVAAVLSFVGTLAAGCLPAQPTDSVPHSPTPARREATTTLPTFDLSAPFPIEAAANAQNHCGTERPDLKLFLRMDPPTLVAPATWRFRGCVASPGNRFYEALVVLRAPDNAVALTRTLASEIDGNADFYFEFEYTGTSVAGVTATLNWFARPR